MKKVLTVLFLFLVPFSVLAQRVEIRNPLSSNNILNLIDRIIVYIFTLAIPIAVIMYIIAGYRFITAAGDPAKVDTAKKMVLWVSIGLLVATASRGLVALMREIIGV